MVLEVLLRYHVRVARLPVVDWARELLRATHSLPSELGTGVLWVSTGTHPCGPPPRQDGGGTRAPALRTFDDVLRFRGDVDYRRVLLQDESRSTEGQSVELAFSRTNGNTCLSLPTSWFNK